MKHSVIAEYFQKFKEKEGKTSIQELTLSFKILSFHAQK